MIKRYFYTGLLFILVGITYLYREDIAGVYNKIFLTENKEVKLEEKNAYYRNYSYSFVQETDDFSPKNKQDIYNIYYTAINSGLDEFTFYCPEEYEECISDVKYLSNDQTTLSDINNFIHPFNSFKYIETSYDSNGKVSLKVDHSYTKEEISQVEAKIKEIEDKFYDESLDKKEIIKKYHDYIIDNTKYDSNRSDKNIIKYKSDIAYGPLIEGYALCGGYTDTMAILLNDLGINNFKITSENHVWNAVLLDDNWYHLDLTWDDPVTSDGSELIEEDFFLITTEKLFEIEKNEHNYNKEIYKEI